MTYVPEKVTSGNDVRIEKLSSALGKVVAIKGEMVVVSLPWGEVTIPTRALPDGVENGSRIRLSHWNETAESLQAGRAVSEVRLAEAEEQTSL